MDEHPPLEAGEEEYDGRELTGYEATLAWRGVRGLIFGSVAVLLAAELVSWLFWDRTLLQLTWIGLGISALTEAALIWRHNLLHVTYHKISSSDGEEATFVGRPSPVPRVLATPALTMAGALLILAGTSTRLGGALSSAFGMVKTIYDGGMGLVAIPVAIIIILLLVAGVLGFLGVGLYYFGKFVVRGFRPDEVEGVGGFQLGASVIALVVLALLIFSLLWSPNPWLDETLAPIQTIWGWFT